MNKFTNWLLIALCSVTLTFGTVGCNKDSEVTPVVTEQPTTHSEVGQAFIEKSWKTYRSIDIAADAIFKILGDMYQEGQLTKAQADSAIAVGKPIKKSMATAKASITLLAQAKESVDAKESVVKNLVNVVKNFNIFKEDASKIYESVTGMPLVVPNLSLFTEVMDAL